MTAATKMHKKNDNNTKPRRQQKKKLSFALGLLSVVAIMSDLSMMNDAETINGNPQESDASMKSTVSSVEGLVECDFSKPSSINFTSLVQRLGFAKVFDQRFMNGNNDKLPSWCVLEAKEKKDVPKGIMYTKLPKSASSTTSGIVLRIANNIPARYNKNKTSSMTSTPCMSSHKHLGEGKVKQKFGGRDVNRSFLIGSSRYPARRAISHIFFRWSRLRGLSKDWEPTDDNMMEELQSTDHRFGAISPGQGGFQLAYLTMESLSRYHSWNPELPTAGQHPHYIHEAVQNVMNDYDFLILAERYDESIVAMQLLLGLETTDILYLSSKVSGNSYHFNNNKCWFSKKGFVSDKIRKYFQSDEWVAKSYGDYLLIEAISQSLDMTINAFNTEHNNMFQEAFDKFITMKAEANKQCAAAAYFPCSSEGKPQPELAKTSCYAKDWGCGYPCIDNLTMDTPG